MDDLKIFLKIFYINNSIIVDGNTNTYPFPLLSINYDVAK